MNPDRSSHEATAQVGRPATPKLDRTLTALAEPNRRQIVDQLAGGACTPGELTERLGLSGPALSKHLKVLRQNDLVVVSSDAQDARIRRYALQGDRLQDLTDWLNSLQDHWQEQLAAFKDYVESDS